MPSLHLDGEVSEDRSLTVLLIDDQEFVGEAIREMLADLPDLRFHHCTDPAKAVEMANALQPAVILLDLVMPEIDGLLLVKFFRVNRQTRDTPMIVLSSKEEPVIKARAFSLGANDYLVKLPDKVELVARVKYHARAHLNLIERNQAFRELADAQQRTASELAQAARYVQSLLPKPLADQVTAEWKFVPSTQLAGDIFGYHWIDSEHFALYLLDVSGHGVGSALLAVSAGNILAGGALPGTDFKDPGKVLTSLNNVFQMDRQNEKYFTIWYGVYHAPTRELRYSNAGHPAPILLDAGLRPLESSSFAVGMVPEVEYETEQLTIPPGTRLLLFSDGVFEIEKHAGGMWNFNDLVAFLSPLRTESTLMSLLYDHVREIHGSDILGDDFSIVDFRFH